MTEPRKWSPPVDEDVTTPQVLIPGTHKDEGGDTVEIGTDDFVCAVLEHLPEGAIYRMGEMGRCAIGTIEGEPGHRAFVVLSDTRLRTVIDAHVRLTAKRCKRVKQDDGSFKLRYTLDYVPCSRDLAGLVLSHATSSPHVREVRQVAHHPVYLPGWALAQPGWNPEGRVYLDLPPGLDGLTPRTEKPLDALEDLLIDYPFRDNASRENAFALIVTRVVRPALMGTTPFFWWMASLERTGKGKGIDACNLATAGESMPVMQVGRTEEEREKRITSLITRGADAVHLDNIPHGEEFDSPSIASLATAYPTWSGRVLGGSNVIVLPNTLTVCVSANNPKATGEIAKRSVPIVLESKTAAPELRDDFVHPDPIGYPLSRRREILETVLGMVEVWKAAGKPSGALRFGGFERWALAVGGIMRVAGASDFLTNRAAWVKAANDDSADGEALVTEWARLHGTNPIQPKAALDIAESLDIFAAHMANATTDRGRQTAFSRRVLSQLVGRPMACGHIVRKISVGSSSFYALEKADVFN